MAGKEKRFTRRVAAPPQQGGLPVSTSHVFAVILEDGPAFARGYGGQAVQWIWAHGPEGSYLSGYRIMRVSSAFSIPADCAD
jgi:hypothetical protein